MPRNALHAAPVDYSVPLANMPALLVQLVHEMLGKPQSAETPSDLDVEVNIAAGVDAADAGVHGLGEPSRFTCPECHGVLLRLKDAHPLRFRCHTGHAFSVESLLDAIRESAESSLWSAVRVLAEESMLLQHASAHLLESGDRAAARQRADEASGARRAADTVRAIITERAEDLAIPRRIQKVGSSRN